MKCKKEKVMKHIPFLLNDIERPGVVFNLDGTLLFVNNKFGQEFGVQESESIEQFIDKQSIKQWDEVIGSLHECEEKIVDIKIQTASGSIHATKAHLMYVDDAHQIVAFFDVQHYNDNLAGKAYVHAFHNSDNFMVVVDQQDIIREVNDMHTAFFNMPKDYFVGKHASVLTTLFQSDTELFLKYKKDVHIFGYVEETKRYEQSVDDIRYYHISTFFDSKTKMYLIRMNDRTEKVILEERLAHSGSLSTVGELAASIAHEIRNPMTTLKGFVQLLKLSADGDAIKYLAVIEGEVTRMESILSEMLILSKPGLNKKTLLSLEVLVADMVQIMQPKAILEGISIEQKVTCVQNTLMNADADKMKQVLLNLFKNAFEAMSPGGILTTTIESDNSQQLILSISDTGKGMNNNQINQVFMPFFTSKPEGTGLGLPFVLKVIEEHGGTISVESELGQGTTFIVTFPLVIAHMKSPVQDDKKLLSS
ncbi:ATP-binding protein [Sporosarcina beigongshangi]|uniref:ATP-binding protein n=1 Tax=Sporosarcina beigongshangi TaxID=2782538 RepID=UPI001939535B|nr:ATP-binding protein [Sporosarcina beigongshangi]